MPSHQNDDATGSATTLAGRIQRRKTSEHVVEHLLEQLFEGKLRTGQRVDIDSVAESLGVSRSPVREALVILERDGIVATRFHRGVHVAPFDADSIVDNFEIYGVLSGLAVSRLARRHTPEVLLEIRHSVDQLGAAGDDPIRTEELIQEIVRAQHIAGGSPRLRAELRTFSGFMPWVFRLAGGRSHERAHAGQVRVLEAIEAGDAEAASRERILDFTDAGREVARELHRRGVFSSAPTEGVS